MWKIIIGVVLIVIFSLSYYIDKPDLVIASTDLSEQIGHIIGYFSFAVIGVILVIWGGMQKRKASKGKKRANEKIGGVLILPLLGLFGSVIGFVYTAYNCLKIFLNSDSFDALTNPSSNVYHFLWFPILMFEFLFSIFFIIATVFTIVLFLKRKKALPKLIVALYLAFFVFILIDYLFVPWMMPSLMFFDEESIKTIVKSFFMVFVWIPYFLFSERVKRTFVRGERLPKAFYVYFGAVCGGIILISAGMSFYGYSTGVREGEIYLSDSTKSAVVNIFCPYMDEEFSVEAYGEGGSGIMLTPEGMILTNAHVYPQDEKVYLVHEKGCFVAIPNPKTGEAAEIYLAQPYAVEGWSEYYDIAYLEIYDSYGDDYFVAGEFPKEFDNVSGLWECAMEDLDLGDPVMILGYPSLSGGTNLTITEGIVSGFYPEEQFILTSAQVTYGNSGGLALAKTGCFIGIPSTIFTEEVDSLGGIISTDAINEFFEKADEPWEGE
ncbi:MAG: DUF2569 family protein [Candidatus Gracilibacteria bacterium]